MLAHALERSFSALLVPLFFLGLMCICMAGIIYYVEGVRRTPHAAPAPRERRVWGGGQGGGCFFGSNSSSEISASPGQVQHHWTTQQQ